MSFEEVPSRVHKSRKSWGMSIAKSGITLWIPRGHWLEKSSYVVTQIGKSEDLGKLRLLPATAGRRVNLANKNTAKKSYFVKYSTLTGAPPAMPMATLDVLEDNGTSVTLRLPWARVAAVLPPTQQQQPTGYSIRR